ncbi:MAG TPA: hypothetical protein VMU01_14165 [Rhizomicrobium sp.]|nr:hypothetical protein [Rhizomicrobium sp.]
MSLTSKEAAESLAQAEQAHRRSAELYHYSRAAPHLIMWGAIWVAGYGGTYLVPNYWQWLWGALIVCGCIGGYFVGQVRPDCKNGAWAWRMTGVMAVAVAFVACTYAIMWPVHGAQYAAYPALLTGAIYAAVGLWVGLRYLVTGALVMALTLAGFFTLHDNTILLWMAFVGGGSMILAGVWFRTV